MATQAAQANLIAKDETTWPPLPISLGIQDDLVFSDLNPVDLFPLACVINDHPHSTAIDLPDGVSVCSSLVVSFAAGASAAPHPTNKVIASAKINT